MTASALRTDPFAVARAPKRADRRRARRALTTAMVALLVAGVSGPVPAAAQDPTPVAEPTPTAPVAPLAALDEARALLPERVRAIPASSAALGAAEQRIVTLEQTIVTNRAIRDEANLELVTLAAERQAQRTHVAVERSRRRDAAIRAERHRSELEALAVEAYVGGGPDAGSFPLDAAATNDAGRQRVIVDAVDTTLRARLAAAEAEVVESTASVDTALRVLAEIVETIEVTTARRDVAVTELARAEPALPVAQQDFREAFMVANVAGSDMSVVAYDAYATAAAGQAACGLPWTVLAGIGRTESRHGTYGGARPQGDGTTSPRIIGIALDGRPGIATIGDTDGGAFDGDTTYDRAVGPMQFIPGTWRSMARDGNGDGRADPHNLYDASAAAGAYLCRLGGGLGNAGNLNRAILSYNQSQVYVNTVLSYRRGYDALGLPG